MDGIMSQMLLLRPIRAAERKNADMKTFGVNE